MKSVSVLGLATMGSRIALRLLDVGSRGRAFRGRFPALRQAITSLD